MALVSCGHDQELRIISLCDRIIEITGAEFQIEIGINGGQVDRFGKGAVLSVVEQLGFADRGEVGDRFDRARLLHRLQIHRQCDGDQDDEDDRDEEDFNERKAAPNTFNETGALAPRHPFP
ncbi:MAG: hypothetical protein HY352_06120 [Candidatus Omnitrophica bacterium]|nr:hypothetical protein [Candidatus Omnitrophota bacterium]